MGLRKEDAMAFINPFILANRGGIPRIESTGVSVGASSVSFSFKNHPFLSQPFTGLILVKIDDAIPAGTTATLPIVFNTNGVSKNLLWYDDAEVTVANWSGTGIYLAVYDSTTGKLQLLTGYTTT